MKKKHLGMKKKYGISSYSKSFNGWLNKSDKARDVFKWESIGDNGRNGELTSLFPDEDELKRAFDNPNPVKVKVTITVKVEPV